MFKTCVLLRSLTLNLTFIQLNKEQTNAFGSEKLQEHRYPNTLKKLDLFFLNMGRLG